MAKNSTPIKKSVNRPSDRIFQIGLRRGFTSAYGLRKNTLQEKAEDVQ